MKRPVFFGSLLALVSLSVGVSAAPEDTVYAHPGSLVAAMQGGFGPDDIGQLARR